MIKQKIKVNFHKHWNPKTGTCYSKGITITGKVYDVFCDVLRCEKAQEKEYYRHLWLSTPIKFSKNVRFLNLTQAKLFCNWISKLCDTEVNKKRLFYDSNTYLIIKKEKKGGRKMKTVSPNARQIITELEGDYFLTTTSEAGNQAVYPGKEVGKDILFSNGAQTKKRMSKKALIVLLSQIKIDNQKKKGGKKE
jgi:hypothetical protein